MSENLINQVNTGRLIKNIIGWADFNDLTTASAPIELTVADDWYQLTNDGAGDFTNTAYKVDGHKDIWDVDNQQFDFSDLRLGDTVVIRLDVEFDLNASNTDIGLRLNMAVGSPGPYPLLIDERTVKRTGTHQVVRWFGIYMGDMNTLSYPATISVSTDNAGDDVKVNGWYIRTTARS